MVRAPWEWVNSNKKTAKAIMLANQGHDYEAVCHKISEACKIDQVAARALYRRVVATELGPDQGFVPAVIRRGRKPKNMTPDAFVPYHSHATRHETVANTAIHDTSATVAQNAPEVKRTETGERLSIVQMREYLANLKLPEPIVKERFQEGEDNSEAENT